MGRPKVDIMEKRIPMNLSIKRSVVLEYERVCKEQGLSKNDIAENLFLDFIMDLK